MRCGVWLPIFDDLADPLAVARLAALAEESGWDGLFVWDQVRWRDPVEAVADPWITLAAVAGATERLRLGPMVTPLARRRAAKLARETATLDRLSGGRLTLGVGLGGDSFAEELSRTGEELDDRVRAAVLDETLAVLRTAWTGEEVHHRGEHVTVDGVRFLPTPVQQPGVPVWVATLGGRPKPLRRAARHDGLFAANLTGPDHLAELVATVTAMRAEAGAAGPYDVVAEAEPGDDVGPWVAAGATWVLTAIEPTEVGLDRITGVIADGPWTL